MLASVFLKSNRCRTSLAAWFKALSTSCRSTLLTMSNELSPATFATPFLRCLPGPLCRIDLTGFAGGSPVVVGVGYCFSPPQDGTQRGMAGCPSGQRERSVKSSAEAYVGSNPTPATSKKLASD